MAAPFLIFLGLIAYLGLIVLSSIVFVPMLFIDSMKLLAKKALATVLISFPCLIAVGIFWLIIFSVPAIVFSGLAYSGFIPRTLGIIMAIAGLLLFSIVVATSALYLWYFMCKIIYQRIYKKPFKEVFDNDSVFKFLSPYLIKLKLYNPDN